MLASTNHDQTIVCRPEDDTRISRPSESRKSTDDVPDFAVSGPELLGFVEDTHRQIRQGKGVHLALAGALRRLRHA